MIYSTCTFNPDENERNMEWAVKELGAEVLPLDMPQGVGITTVTFEGGEGYSFLPHKVKGEGFFICLLHKKTDAPSIPTTAPRRDKRTAASRTSLKETTTGREYVNDSRLFVKEDKVIAFPIDRADRMYTLTDALTPIWAGTAVCTVMTKKGKTETNPSPELPLSLSFNRRSVPCINVDCENALKFLAKGMAHKNESELILQKKHIPQKNDKKTLNLDYLPPCSLRHVRLRRRETGQEPETA